MFPKTLFASVLSSAPRNLEISEEPPTPMAIPMDDIRKVIGMTTETAAIPIEPTNFPMKMESAIK